MDFVNIASSILKRAVDLDNNKRYTEALVCYQEGIQVLIDVSKGETAENKKSYLRSKIEEYMSRAEKLKEIINDLKEEGQFHEQISIENNSIGHSYEKIFKRFLDYDVTYVIVEDPYIRMPHQCQNFVRFCEVLIKNCPNIKKINLVTSPDKKTDQEKSLICIQDDLKLRHIDLDVTFSATLHDRKITVSNGWIVKIGRGLDYFKASKNRFSIGTYDYDFRPCHETNIDIFHEKNVKQTTG